MTPDIISAIDAATGCQHCGNPLGSSPSSDFCSEFCQGAWHAKRVKEVAFSPGVLHIAPVGTPYELGGAAWHPIGYAVPAREFRAHFEIRADGSVVDNTAAIRHRNERCNEDIRGWVGPEVWEYLREGGGS